MAGPGVYRKRLEKRERQKMAEKLSDMPWERDPYTGRVTGRLVGETGDIARTPEDVERWGRSAARTAPPGARKPRAAAPGEVSIPAFAEPGGGENLWQQWKQGLNLWPAPPGEYARWPQQGSRQKYQNWKDWYAPGGEVEDQPHLAVINKLLPYMAEEDVDVLARQLYTAGGGRKGPFKYYLGDRKNPAYGPPNRQPRGDWLKWADWVEGKGMIPEGSEGWWGQRPQEGRVREWEKWWGQRPQGTEGLPGPIATSSVSRMGVSEGMPSGVPGEGWPDMPEAPVRADTHRETMNTIGTVIRGIPDPTAKAWAKSVFGIYRSMTPVRGMRGSEQEARLQARLDELFASVPESAEPYAAAMQRLVQPTVLRPEQEWYELPSAQRTAPTNWTVAAGLRANPSWL